MNAPPTVAVYEFDGFCLDSAKRLLSREDATIPLTPRVFDTLLFLIEHRGIVLDKERLMEAVWPDSIVEENNLTQNISTLRRVFGETPGSHRFIVTVPGRGYRFVADVRENNGSASTHASETPSVQDASEDAPPENQPASPQGPKKSVWPTIGSAVIVVAIATGAFFLLRPPRVQPVRDEPVANARPIPPDKSIAVLPFENLSAEPENLFFATGIQDEILSNLAKLSELKVISRASANLYRSGSPRNVREIGEQLGAAHLLEGSVQRVGDRVRVNAQLIDTRTDAHVWAQSYDRDLADVFAIQAEIAQAIAGQLQAHISPPEQAAIAHPATNNLEAAALYSRALSYQPRLSDPQNLLDSIRLLEQAVAADPNFVVALCEIAHAHLNLYFGGYDHSPARRDLAAAAIEEAARIQPNAGQIHVARAQYWLHGFRDYDRARAELDEARKTLPNEPKIYVWSVAMDRRQGRWSEATRNGDRAIEIDPRNVDLLTMVAGTYERLHRYRDAAKMYDRAVAAAAPNNYFPRVFRASLPLIERGDLSPLREELNAIVTADAQVEATVADGLFHCALLERDHAAVDRALATIPQDGVFLGGVWPREWYIARAARTFGDNETARAAFTKARESLEKIVREQPDYAVAWGALARIDAGLGEKERAIAEGRRACELLPPSKDAWFAVGPLNALACTYAWTGEKDLACEQLELLEREGGTHYGELKLNPDFDALHGYPRFESILARLAPPQ